MVRKVPDASPDELRQLASQTLDYLPTGTLASAGGRHPEHLDEALAAATEDASVLMCAR